MRYPMDSSRSSHPQTGSSRTPVIAWVGRYWQSRYGIVGGVLPPVHRRLEAANAANPSLKHGFA